MAPSDQRDVRTTIGLLRLDVRERLPETRVAFANPAPDPDGKEPDDPPDWLQQWADQVGAELKDGLRENPSWIAFARENGTVYHTYTVSAPDPFVAPYFSFLMERTPLPHPPVPNILRKDEYPAD